MRNTYLTSSINKHNASRERKLPKYASSAQHWIKGLLDLKGRHAERSKIIMRSQNMNFNVFHCV